MPEAVRLVIWDLDETFWRGTLTEGGIKEYVAEHHDIVVELARRGIMSSICSKNEPSEILPILQEKGILDYFVFPSISWQPKGSRILNIIEEVGLRPATVMFIDDNASNRAEAQAIVPELQIEDENFITGMLMDPRFVGKDDLGMTRLKQYKLLYQKKRDEQASHGSNEDFLRKCDIKIYIDFDVESNIDRAVELINRTNQLNYTKRRLPEDGAAARAELLSQLRPFDTRAGLVRVWDKYGDYGYVGFFLTRAMREEIVEGASNTNLIHFCFSCRTLGMLVEQWTFNYLGCPELKVVGDCLTELVVGRDVDWISQSQSLLLSNPSTIQIAPKIIVVGGCEAHSVSAYFGSYAPEVQVIGNYAAHGFFTRVNSSAILQDMAERPSDDFAEEAAKLGLPLHLELIDIFAPANEGAHYLMNLGLDRGYHHLYRHRERGWTLYLEMRLVGAPPILSPLEKISEHLDANPHFYDEHKRQHILSATSHFSQHYEMVQPDMTPESRLREIVERIPRGGKLVFTANHHQSRPNYPSDQLKEDPDQVAFVEMLRKIALDYDFVGVVPVSDVIEDFSDIQEADHYARQVYFRLAMRVVETFETLYPRSESPASKRRILLDLLKREATARNPNRNEIRALVDAAFTGFFRRPPENDYYVDMLCSGRLTISQFIRGIGSSREFHVKWRAVNPVTGEVIEQKSTAAE